MIRKQILDEAVRRKTNAFSRVWINSLALPPKAAKFIIADIVMEFHKLSKSVGRDSEEADSGRGVTPRPATYCPECDSTPCAMKGVGEA